jgi:hypothetical protein
MSRQKTHGWVRCAAIDRASQGIMKRMADRPGV